jgi:hypothetical protein
MRNQVILAAVAMALFGACVGGIDMPPGGDDDTGGNARQMFDQTVLPLMRAKCASCHVGPEVSATNMFLGPDGESSFYTTLVADRAVNGGFDPAAATILLKGAHDGPAWTTPEADKIAAWLRAEFKVRGSELPEVPPNTPNNASARGASMAFVACMKVSLADFTTLQAYQIANMNTNQQGRCYSCHNGGAGGQHLSISNQYKDMHAKWQEEVFFTGVFQAQIQVDRTYKIVPAQTKICNKGREKDNNLGTHPEYDCAQNNNTALLNLGKFVTKVQGMVDARDPLCGAPAFAPPTP